MSNNNTPTSGDLVPLIEASLITGSVRLGGILLHGPSGVGKSRLCNEIVEGLTNVKAHHINFTSLFGKSFGGAEDSIVSIFEELEKMAPVVCICEDVDSLCTKGGTGITLLRTRALFYNLLDEMHSKDVRIIFIYSSRDPQFIDRALFSSGRVDLVLELTPPNFEERMIILRGMTQRMFPPSADTSDASDASDVVIEHVARRTHGFLGSDLERLCRQAVLETIRRCGVSAKETEVIDFDNAFRVSQHPSSTEVYASSPSLRGIDRLGGMSQVFERLKLAVVDPLRAFAESRPAADERILSLLGVGTPRGVIIHGPSGCGKSALALALASELKDHARFINIPCTSLVHAEVGSSEKQLSAAFNAARRAAPALILLDQIDSIALKRDSAGDSSAASTMDRILSLLLVELDGALQGDDGLVVLATTHDVSKLEPALLRPGRLDQHIALTLPCSSDREEILGVLTKDIPLALSEGDGEEVDERRAQLFRRLAGETDGWSGADLSHLCQEAAMVCLRENMHSPGVSTDNFITALHSRTRTTY